MSFISDVFGGGDDPEDLGIDEALADVNNKLHRKQSRFGQVTEERLKRSMENRDTVDEATANAEKARTLLSGMDERNTSRVGDTRSGPEQEATEMRRALNKKKATADAANNARVEDEEFKNQTLQTLVDRGTQLSKTAQSGLSKAASMEQKRQAANERAEAEAGGGVGSLLGAGVGFAVGGPMGAAAGSQIGGSAGKALG